MGTTYTAHTVIGYVLDDTCFDKLLKVSKEKSHVEKRFDSKSGKRLADVTIIDSPEMKVWVFEGKEYSADYSEGWELSELCEAIASKVKCNFAEFCRYSDDDSLMSFHPNKGAYTHHENSPLPISLAQMKKMVQELDRIAKALKALKITHVGKPGIHAILDGC